MNNGNPFRRAPRPQPEEVPQTKPTSELTDAELDESLRQARKDLLEAQHDALRERERARVAPSSGAPSGRPNLGSIFKKKGFR